MTKCCDLERKVYNSPDWPAVCLGHGDHLERFQVPEHDPPVGRTRGQEELVRVKLCARDRALVPGQFLQQLAAPQVPQL